MSDCKHHWLIEEPNGPTVMGQCKHCGAEREFKTALDFREMYLPVKNQTTGHREPYRTWTW